MRLPRSRITFILGMICFLLACAHGAVGESAQQEEAVARKMKPAGVTVTNTMTGQTQAQHPPHVRIEYCTS